MATITPVREEVNNRIIRVTWSGLGQNDDGAGVNIPLVTHRAIQGTGDFSGNARFVIEGSLLENPSVDADWFRMMSPQRNSVSTIGVGDYMSSGPAFWIRPHILGGNGSTDINAILMFYKMV